MRKEQAPTIKTEKFAGGDSETLEHPAFGTITMTTVTGGNVSLFDSDLRHDQRVRIRVSTANMRRNLSNDLIHSDKTLLEFEMSHAQFGRFIASNGNGSGTPITIVARRVGENERMATMPEILCIEPKSEIFRREIEESAQRRVQQVTEAIDKISQMAESGKLSKVELRRLVRDAKLAADGFGSSVSFVVSQAHEALHHATNDAKIEVQAVIDNSRQELARLAAAKTQLSGGVRRLD